MTLVERPVAERPPPPTDRTKTSRVARGWRFLPVVPVAVIVALALHLLWWRFLATTGGDIAAQDAWAEFARTHPGSAYNFAWYGGMHPVSYSVLSPYLMAALGVRPTMVIAGALSAGLLARLFTRLPGIVRPAWPAWYAAVALTGNAISGRVTFALGTVFGLGVLCVIFAWPERWHGDVRRWPRGLLAAALAVLATAASPVAGLFLGLVAAPLWLAGRRAAAYAIGLPPVVVVVASALLFPFSGEQPMSWISVILPLVVGASVVLFVPESWRTVRLGGAVYLVAVVLAWLVPSPIGTNIARLGLLFGGLALLAAAVSDRPGTSVTARWTDKRTASILLVLAILTSTIWQIGMAGRDAANSSPPSSWSVDLQPLIKQLERRDADIGRVEVVPTRNHREAAALAPYVNLARGWNRQADADRNPIFYEDQPLTAAGYQRWLSRWAVRYVVLSTADPDPAAVSEAELVTVGLPYLQRVWSNADWTLFAVRKPTPLVSRPARVVEFDAAEITIATPRGGTYVVRVADSPWLSLVDASGDPLPGPVPTTDGEPAACLTHVDADETQDATQRRDDWLILEAPTAGTYRIAAPYKLPRGTACP
jgi:hypothetical protein